ncbi:MAG TPA: sulfite exporter TauE/SafE family protein [Candidatus Binatia bacterium]|jgi:hypothetical protein
MAYDFTYPTVALALLVAAFVKGATGLGFPLIATPTVALLLDIRTAVTILILPNLFMDSAQVIRDGFPYAILRRFQRLNRADDRWSFSWDTGAGENALVGAQSVSRRHGFDLRDREYVQVGVYRVCP